MPCILERVRTPADWFSALSVALTRPDGVPERRTGEDPWTPPRAARPRRVSDDLAWLRRAMDDPAAHGLQPVDAEQDMPAWHVTDDDLDGRLDRLRQRGVLDAAGFVLHESGDPR